MITNARVVALLLASIVSLSTAANEQAEPETSHPLTHRLARILTGDSTQWRTINPDYQEGGKQPAEYGLRLRMMPDQRHATGELTGVYSDGREALYWSLLAFYNPVTEQVVLQQIGWDGTLLRGEVAVQPGRQQISI